MPEEETRHDDFLSEEDQDESQEVLSLENLRKAFSEALQEQGADARSPESTENTGESPEVYPFPQPEEQVGDATPGAERQANENDVSPTNQKVYEEPDSSRAKEPPDRSPSVEEGSVNDEEGFGDEAVDVSPRTILESMLFVGHPKNEPLDPARVAPMMRNVTPEEIAALVEQLNAEYHRSSAPYTIVPSPGGYRMVLREEYEIVRSRFYGKVRESRLSQASIDVLAVVAYRQPITPEEVQKIRGTDSGSVLSQLVRRELLSVERQVREKRRVKLYRTTDRFLKLFELDSLDDLPTTEEIDFR